MSGETKKVTLPGCRCGATRYLSTSQVARRWSVSSITVHRLIERGALSGLRIGHGYRISKVSIEEYESKVSF